MRGIAMIGAMAVAAAALSGILGGCATTDRMHRETRHSESPHIADTPLRVVTANGGIEVREGAQELVQIRAELKAQTPERLAATAVTADRLDDGTLAIGVVWPDGKRLASEGCYLQVTLPRASGVELRTTNGGIDSIGMGGEGVFTTTNASVEVLRHAGPVAVETSNGGVRISGAGGPVRARSSNGAIRVENAAAAVDVETSNASVEIGLSDGSKGPARVRTDNAGVALRLGRAFEGELSLKTSGGRLDLDGLSGATVLSKEAGAARLQVGEGGQASSVQTSNGTIRVQNSGR